MIIFDSVTKVFDKGLGKGKVEVLKDVSFTLSKGKITGFLGANGAGKTTSIKIIMDIIRPTSGSVSYDPTMGKSFKEIFSHIGFLPERPYFYPFMRGKEFLRYLSKLSKVSKVDYKKMVTEYAPILKIDHALDRKIESYSKGMLQRIGFLATLIHKPDLIILDEPLSGLDPIGRHDLKKLILKLKSEGKTVFFSSHIVSDVEEICDDILFLKDGEISYHGPLYDLVKQYENKDYEAVYMKNDQVVNESILGSDYSKFLERIQRENIDLISLSKERITLEEIVYKVKENA